MGCIKYENSEGSAKSIASEFEIKIENIKSEYEKNNLKNASSEDILNVIVKQARELVHTLKNSGEYELKTETEWNQLNKTFNDLRNKSKQIQDISGNKVLVDLIKKGFDQVITENKDKLASKRMVDTDYLYKNTKTFKDTYNADVVLQKYYEGLISDEILRHILIDDKNLRIVRGDANLNRSIAALKDKLFFDLRRFVHHYEGEKDNSRTSMYHEGTMKTSRLLSMINRAEPHINNIPINKLKSIYNKNQFSTELTDNVVLNGHLAYTLLKGNNFDKMLVEVLGDNLLINKKFGTHSNQTDLKYKLKGVSELRSSWNDYNQSNALDAIGKIPHLLITRTPLIDSKTGYRKGTDTVSVRDFMNTMNKLKGSDIVKNYLNQLENYNIKNDTTMFVGSLLNKILMDYNHNSRRDVRFTKADYNIFKSVYESFYNPNNKKSLYNIVKSDQSISGIISGYNLINSISALIDRSTPVSYLQYTLDSDGQEIVTRINNRTFNAEKSRVNSNIQSIAQLHGNSTDIDGVLNKYNVRPDVQGDGDIGSMRFTISFTHGGESIDVNFKYNMSKNLGGAYRLQFLDGPVKNSKGEIIYSTTKDIKTIDSGRIADAVLNNKLNSLYTDENNLYLNLLSFVSDVLNIDLLSSTYVRHIAAMEGLTNLHFLTSDLMSVANDVLHRANTYKEFSKYKLENDSNPEVITDIKSFVNNASLYKSNYYRSLIQDSKVKDSLIFDPDFNQLVVSNNANTITAIEHMAEASEIVSNAAIKGVVKNASGNAIPVTRISNQVGNFFHTLSTRGLSENSVLHDNLFVSNKEIFEDTLIKSDSSIQGTAKNVSDYTTGELIHSDFILGYLNMLKNSQGKSNKSVKTLNHNQSSILIQPLVVSDKKFYVNLLINAEHDIELIDPRTQKTFKFNLKNATDNQLKLAIESTIGQYYNKLGKTVKDDYAILFNHKINGQELGTKALLKSQQDLESLTKIKNVFESQVRNVTQIQEGPVLYNHLNFDSSIVDLLNTLIIDNAGDIIDANNIRIPEISFDKFKKDANKLINNYVKEVQDDNKYLSKIIKDHNKTYENYLTNVKPKQQEVISLKKLLNDFNIISNLSQESDINNEVLLNYLPDNIPATLNDRIDLAITNLLDGYDGDVQNLFSTITSLEKELSGNNTIYNNVYELYTLQNFDRLLKYTNESDLRRSAFSNKDKGVNIVEDLHITKNNNTLRANAPLIYYNESLYNFKNNSKELNNYFKNEEIKLASDFYENNIKLNLTDSDGVVDSNLEWGVNNILKNKKKDWVDGRTNSLVIAKADGKIIKNKFEFEKAVQEGKSIAINPILSKYLYTHYFISKNYRNLITGTEINYPYFIKQKGSSAVENMDTIELMLSNQDLAHAKRNSGPVTPVSTFTQNDISGISDEIRVAVIEETNAQAFNYTGDTTNLEPTDGSTEMVGHHHYLENFSLQDLKTGKTKKAVSFNTESKYGTGIFLKFATYVLTNEIMKESMYSTDSGYSRYRKSTDFSWTKILNENKFKRLNQLNSEGKYLDYKIDLTKNLHGENISLKELGFEEDIFKSKELIYEIHSRKEAVNNKAEATIIIRDGITGLEIDRTVNTYDVSFLNSIGDSTVNPKTVKILDLIKADNPIQNGKRVEYLANKFEKDLADYNARHGTNDDGSSMYYMEVNPVNEDGTALGPRTKFYELVKIDSHFQLHKAFGGVDSFIKVDNELVRSDASLMLGALYANNVGIYHGGYETSMGKDGKSIQGKPLEMLSQLNTFQPLKDPSTYIAYLVKDSAMKIGRMNVNKSSIINTNNNQAFDTMILKTDALGIQQDTDNVIESDSNISEVSQVIQAVAAKGYAMEKVNSLYRTLSNIAKNESKDLVESVKTITEARSLADGESEAVQQAKTKLAVMTMRELMRSLKNTDSTYGAQKGILELIKESYDRILKTDEFYSDIVFKIPASDPSIYKKMSTDFVNAIANVAIKRRVPGEGFTMSPSHNTLELFRFPFGENFIESDQKLSDIDYDYNASYKLTDVEKMAKNMTYTTLDALLKYRLELEGSPIYENYFKRLYKNIDTNNISDISTETLMKSKNISSIDLLMAYQANINKKHLSEFEQGFTNIDRLLPESAIKLLPGDVEALLKSGKISVDWVSKNTKLNAYDNMYDAYIQTIEDYILVKNNFTKFIPNVTKPTNLRPEMHIWKDMSGKQWNAYDLYQVRNALGFKNDANQLLKKIESLSKNKTSKSSKLAMDLVELFKNKATSKYGYDVSRFNNFTDISGLQTFISDLIIMTTENAENAFNNIGNGTFKATLNGPLENILPGSYQAHALEVILPSMFKDKFGLGKNVSLKDVLTNKHMFFMQDYKTQIEAGITHNEYDLALVNPSHENIYVKFDNINNSNIDISENTPVEINTHNIAKIDNKMYLLDEQGKTTILLSHINESGEQVRDVTLYQTNGRGLLYVVSSKEGFDSLMNHETDHTSFRINNDNRFITTLNYIKNSETNNKNINLVKDYLNESKIDLNSKLDISEMSSNIEKLSDSNLESSAKFKYTSFIKSLDILAARIPAQTMQSFMKSRPVAFTESDSTNIYVSRWQMWLQGADYDIDTSWVMSGDVDNSGIYIGWSPYFSLNSVAEMRASEKLLAPTGLLYNFDGETNTNLKQVDVTDNIIRLHKLYNNKNNSEQANIEFIKEFNSLLYKIDDADAKLIKNDKELDRNKIPSEFVDNDFLLMLNRHSMYLNSDFKHPNIITLNHNTANKAYKNIASSFIMNIVQDPRNVVQAHIPINMDDPKRAAADSPIGKRSARTNFNIPTSIASIQSENGDGVDGISISAVGLKNFTTLTYYYNDILRRGNPHEIKNLLIFKSYDSLKSGYDDNGIRLALANVNWKDVGNTNIEVWKNLVSQKTDGKSKDIIVESIRQQLKVGQDQALIISALLSAATDNAKELILSKLGAGPKTMGIYLYLALMGYEFNSVAKFMTSETVQNIISLAKHNSFEHNYRDNNLHRVIKRVEEGPVIYDYLSNDLANSLFTSSPNSLGFDRVSYFNEYIKDLYNDPNIDTIEKLNAKLIDNFSRVPDNYKYALNRLSDDFLLYKQMYKSMDKQILKDFSEILEDSNSTIILGQALGINQGIKTLVSERLSFATNFVNHFFSTVPIKHENKAKIARLVRNANPVVIKDGPVTKEDIDIEVNRITDNILKHGLNKRFSFFDFISPNSDKNGYSDTVIEVYNLFKPGFNVFDVIKKVPQINEAYNIMWSLHEYNGMYSYKYRTTYEFVNKIVAENLANDKLKFLPPISDSQISKIESYVDDKTIYEWIQNRNIKFYLKGGDKYIVDNTFAEAEVPMGQTMEIDLSSEVGISTFKKWVEDIYIELQRGNIDNTDAYTINPDGSIEGDIVNIKNNNIVSNTFIRDLRMHNTTNYDTMARQTTLRLPINMSSLDSDFDATMFQNYSEDLLKLTNYRKGGMNLADIFFIYNLVVNKNKYGADRYTALFSNFNHNPNSLMFKYQSYLGQKDASGETPVVDSDMPKLYIRMAEKAQSYADEQKKAYIKFDPKLKKNVIVAKGVNTDVLNGINLPAANRALKLAHSPLGLMTDVRSSLDVNIKSSSFEIASMINTLYLNNQILIKYNC